jgi:hypothetical protein
MIQHHKTPRIRILRQVNPVQNIPPYFIISFNIINPPNPRPFKKSLPFMKLELNLLRISNISMHTILPAHSHPHWFYPLISYESQSHWPRGLRSRSGAACLLGLRVRISPGGVDVCILRVLCCHPVEAPATGRSLAQRNPTECGVSWVWSKNIAVEALTHYGRPAIQK